MTFERKRAALSGGVALICVTAVIALMLVHFLLTRKPSSLGTAALPSLKLNDSAKKQYLLSNNNGVYVRSGRFCDALVLSLILNGQSKPTSAKS